MTPYYETDNGKLYNGDVLQVLRELPDGIVQCVVTSPPYWGLRDYGTAEWEGGDANCEHIENMNLKRDCSGGVGGGRDYGTRGEQPSSKSSIQQYKKTCAKCGAVRIDKQLGLEATPEEYIDKMVAIFREVRRVMRDDGTLWLNMGDSYAGSGRGRDADGTWNPGKGGSKQETNVGSTIGRNINAKSLNKKLIERGAIGNAWVKPPVGYKAKDLCGIPWRLAFALQADGWYLRSDIIWSKPNPMPESVTDRPTKAHEYVFLMSKQAKYYYDADAVREKHQDMKGDRSGEKQGKGRTVITHSPDTDHINKWNPKTYILHSQGRNRRTVWNIPTQSYSEAHFATFPTALVIPCIKAGTSEKGNCSVCGKPWVRIMDIPYDENHPTYHNWLQKQDPDKLGKYKGMRAHDTSGYGGEVARYYKEVWNSQGSPKRHIGWQPSCTCNADIVKPIVCDPFGGSGTTAEVCERYGRRWILIDLSQDYCNIAVKRIEKEAVQGKLALS